MLEVRQQKIKKVLDAFFNVNEEVDESFGDGFAGVTLDDGDTLILSEAIDQALEKSDEDPSQ